MCDSLTEYFQEIDTPKRNTRAKKGVQESEEEQKDEEPTSKASGSSRRKVCLLCY